MADKSFGAKQINLIGASGTPTIESPNNLNLNAITVAISTDVTIGGQVQSNLKIGSSYSVGIGTTNPTSNLHIQSNAPTITLTDANAAANNKSWKNVAQGQDFYWQALDDGTPGIGVSGGGNLFKFTRSNQQIQTFEGQNSAVTWLKVDNNTQRVGIGTTNLTAKLHVVGDALINYITVGRGSISTSIGFSSAITNTAIGYSALYSNTTGYFNTAIGSSALFSNTTGIFNTSVGNETLSSNTTGNANVALGEGNLGRSITPSNNTAIGDGALYLNTTGQENTAAGSSALFLNTIGIDNTAIGSRSLFYNTTGEFNTGVGRHSLYNNIGGYDNTAVGWTALTTNVSGVRNTAVGSGALSLSTVNYLTAVGAEALNKNTTGESNTAVGAFALQKNTVGFENTATGREALQNNLGGYRNTAIGYHASYAGVNNSNNVAFGAISLTSSVNGSQNTAIGTRALTSLVGTSSPLLGSENTAVGFNALGSLVANDRNIALGSGALSNCLGSQNIGICNDLNPVFNVISHDNRIVIGSTSVTNAYVQVAWTVVSDARDKTNLSTIPHGLDFVNQLKPTAFQFKLNRESEETNGPLRYGFLAQDILALEGPDSVIIDNEDPEKLRYNGESLIPVLVNAINELSTKVKELQNQIDIIKNK